MLAGTSLCASAQTKLLAYDFSYPELIGRTHEEINNAVTYSGHFLSGFDCGKFRSYNAGAKSTTMYRSVDPKLTEGILYLSFLYDANGKCVGEAFVYGKQQKAELASGNDAAFGKTKSAGSVSYWDMGDGVRCRLLDGSDCWDQAAAIIYLTKP